MPKIRMAKQRSTPRIF